VSKLRVGVLDDSAICRAQLRAFLEADGDIEVVCEAPSGENALDLLASNRPQLLVVDLTMPTMDGHSTISLVMANAPLPILVVTGETLGPERSAVFESIRRGALDVAEKPFGTDVGAQRELRAAVRRLARVPVVRHVAGKLNHRPATVPLPSRFPPAIKGDAKPLVVGIASSAGGPVALAGLIGALPSTFHAAILVVQHLPETFAAAFVDFLASRSQLKVVSVGQNEKLISGSVYLSNGDAHLEMLGPDRVGLSSAPPYGGHRPSADVLFKSMARQSGGRAAGVVLSGMGEDGAEGLLALRNGGGLCLAQDKDSCAVWGMPRAALENGAAEQSLPPLAISDVLRTWVHSASQASAP
jgi:two-component system chemotaxis response regulator CheB